ncbi:MAG: universal stress protein [Candidatus Pelagadaptatus aseana]|uniref:universal stress protein n=1 Tax=Candidatus Pelagadaptatus aseana TaxID=3120508 RepID=UPI0039B1C588
MKKILVSLDLAHGVSPLIEQASELGKAFLAEVLVVSVNGDESAATQLGDITEAMVADGVNASVELLSGKVGEQVVAKGNDMDADVIVIGSHGNSSVFDTLMGSAGQDIMQHAGRPVLLVPVPEKS